ncbi:putative uridine phosphorylase [Ancylostoma duodenale]|uniref:Putative uridine phosphorylase n=1 Tax=Ancylostoma duodenale TaxID=51022 RepID=A0A0C2GPZ2_9BILA|nr:putative uridine phosphorylase [Ancylostoma duodenale]
MNSELTDKFVQWIAGKEGEVSLPIWIERETWLDEDLRKDLIAMAAEKNIPVETGSTLCADDFYEGQMRLDGFFCEYNADDKFAFLRKIHDKGVRNIEMESACFASLTYRAGVKAAIVCVTLLNRMKGDQVKIEHDQYIEFEERPFRLVTALIRKQLGY